MIKIRTDLNQFINPKYLIEAQLKVDNQEKFSRYQFIFFIDYKVTVEKYWGDYFDTKEQALKWFKENFPQNKIEVN